MREPGSIVDGKYKVVKSLGRGGMGEVYLARHLHLEELRVIKILRQDLAAEENAQKRFLREARLATQIKHPNVAILYDFAQLPEGSFYMVWEHIEGQHVGEWLAEKGHIPLQPALELGIQTLRGLEAIHSTGVVHRDISPDNLMIARDRRGRYLVKIIDLGLAKNLVADPNLDVTQAGMFMGKLKYCSPEQAETENGETVDARSDLYSFGLVLYEMISGVPPFEAENPHAAVMKRLSESPPPLSERNSEVVVPKELDRILAQALEREPQNRFPDAVQFIVALESIAFAIRGEETEEDVFQHRQRSAHQPTEIPVTGSSRSATSGRRQKSSSHLSKAERDELLAQIDRAAKKRTETTQILRRAEGLLHQGQVDEARDLVHQVEQSAPRAQGLDRLRRLLDEQEREQPAGDTASRDEPPKKEPPQKEPPQKEPPREEPPRKEPPRDEPPQKEPPREEPPDPRPPREASAERIREMEQMIETYIRNRQLQLAELALESLLEIHFTHPKRGDYEQWIELLRQELEQDRQAQQALEAGRAAIEEGDFKTARKHLAEVEKHDREGELAPPFRKELETAERDQRQTADQEQHRERFEALLTRGQLDDAEKELERLAELGATRVALDLLRKRLHEARGNVQTGRHLEELEKRFAQRLQSQDWQGARKLAQEVAKTAPGNPRATEMYAEIGRLEEEDRRRQALEQGVAHVEQLIETGQPDQAEVALQVLLRMDPQHKRRKQLEKRIRALRG